MTDKLPKVVCEECAYKLDQLYDFREKCLRTEDMFVAMLKRDEDDGFGKEECDDEDDMQTLRVMDDMELAGGEQVVTQEEICQGGEIQVAGIELDGDTVRMVDQHMREMQEEVGRKLTMKPFDRKELV